MQVLRDFGYSDEDINVMSPEEAAYEIEQAFSTGIERQPPPRKGGA